MSRERNVGSWETARPRRRTGGTTISMYHHSPARCSFLTSHRPSHPAPANLPQTSCRTCLRPVRCGQPEPTSWVESLTTASTFAPAPLSIFGYQLLWSASLSATHIRPHPIGIATHTEGATQLYVTRILQHYVVAHTVSYHWCSAVIGQTQNATFVDANSQQPQSPLPSLPEAPHSISSYPARIRGSLP